MNTELWNCSATALVSAMRTGQVSAEEVMASALGRIEQVNPVTNAFVEVADDAMEQAKRADAARRAGHEPGALHGLPVTFKINTNVAGYPTTDGVEAYLHNVASETDPQAQSWLDAGAIMVARSNCPPFATRWTTESEFYGRTRNPWDPEVTPGGSSGGAAVGVATGACALAQGSDIGGSIRYPAACSGVVGIRPTTGRVPAWAGSPVLDPPLAVQLYVVQGPIARTVADLRLGLTAMQAPDPRDPGAVGAFERGASPTRPIRVGLVTDPGSFGLTEASTQEVLHAVRTAGDWLSDAGYAVEEIELPALGEAARLWWQLALTEFRTIGMVGEVERVGDAGIRRFFDLMYQVYDAEFGDVDLRAFLGGYARRGILRRKVSVFMSKFPLLLLPNSGEAPFRHGDDVVSVDRTRQIMARQWPNMALPVLGLPGLGIGVHRNGGAPIGVQIVGRAFHEDMVLAAGEVIEARSQIRTPIDPTTRVD